MSQNPEPLDSQSWANQFYATHNRQPSAEEYREALAAGQVIIEQSAVPAGAAPAPQPVPATPEQKKNAKVLLWSSIATVGLILVVVIILAVIGMSSQSSHTGSAASSTAAQAKGAAGTYKITYTKIIEIGGKEAAPSIPEGVDISNAYVAITLHEDKTCELENHVNSVYSTKEASGCTWEENNREITLKASGSSSEGHAKLSEDGNTLTLYNDVSKVSLELTRVDS